jgi:uncharacterized radical SAM protein YgiQ
MDSMINRYTADRKIRSDDAYTPGDEGGKRPDRAAIVYSQRCREAYKDVPIVLGGIEGSLRRIAHYDYWSDKVRRSIVVDSKCDLLLYGNAERAWSRSRTAWRAREPVEITDVRGTAFVRRTTRPADWFEIDSTEVDQPGRVDEHTSTPTRPPASRRRQGAAARRARIFRRRHSPASAGKANWRPRWLRCPTRPCAQGARRERTVIRLPSYEQVKATRCSTPTPTACCTWRPTPATRARWCRPRRGHAARATCGSTRRRSR